MTSAQLSKLDLAQAARESPAETAVVSAGRSLTYRELDARVRSAASWLLSQGISLGGDRPVALALPARQGSIELFWAAWSLGRPLLLLNTRHTEAIRSELLRRTSAEAVDVTLWERSSHQRVSDTSPLGRTSPTAPRLLVPTAGTTGRPKIAVLSETALLASARASYANMGIASGDRWLLCLSLAHVGGLSILTRSLYARRAAVLFDVEQGLLERATDLAATLERERVTLVSLVPTLLDRLLASDWQPAPELRTVLLGGSSASPSLLQRACAAKVPVLTSYGSSEACSQVATRRYVDRLQAPRVENGIASSGRALDGIELRLDDSGALAVRGPTLCNGYWDDPSPFDDDGFLLTSDRATLTHDGELFVLGREDDVIITGGEKVDPLVIEAALLDFPAIREACVFGRIDERWGQVVSAALSVEGHFGLEELAAHCRARLAPHERPRLVAILDALPQTLAGKPDRSRCAELASDRLAPLSA